MYVCMCVSVWTKKSPWIVTIKQNHCVCMPVCNFWHCHSNVFVGVFLTTKSTRFWEYFWHWQQVNKNINNQIKKKNSNSDLSVLYENSNFDLNSFILFEFVSYFYFIVFKKKIICKVMEMKMQYLLVSGNFIASALSC